MKKGLIICGYPGIGKSSIAGWNNCIDLESSYFSRSKDDCALSANEWVWKYCELAIDLAGQGFTVLVSSHEGVRNYLNDKIRYRSLSRCYIPIVVFCPRPDMKESWAIRLVNRCVKSGSDKDLRALVSCIKDWDTNMKQMKEKEQVLPIYCPMSIDYDLRDYILQIRKKEGCDDEETSSSLEPMAGMEESSLDVPVVEEITDTSRNRSE